MDNRPRSNVQKIFLPHPHGYRERDMEGAKVSTGTILPSSRCYVAASMSVMEHVGWSWVPELGSRDGADDDGKQVQQCRTVTRSNIVQDHVQGNDATRSFLDKFTEKLVEDGRCKYYVSPLDHQSRHLGKCQSFEERGMVPQAVFDSGLDLRMSSMAGQLMAC